VIRNNVFAGWSEAGICYYGADQDNCQSLPETVLVDHNAAQKPFGFVNPVDLDFHLLPNSPLIDVVYDLGTLNGNDFDNHVHPQGAGYDIGAYELTTP